MIPVGRDLKHTRSLGYQLLAFHATCNGFDIMLITIGFKPNLYASGAIALFALIKGRLNLFIPMLAGQSPYAGVPR